MNTDEEIGGLFQGDPIGSLMGIARHRGSTRAEPGKCNSRRNGVELITFYRADPPQLAILLDTLNGALWRESTRSVLMFSDKSTPAGAVDEKPYDSLNFAPTILELTGPSIPDLAAKPIEFPAGP